jgi:hypothetical protein
MNRRQVATLLGYLSFGGVAAFWRVVKAFAQPVDAEAHAERTVGAIAEVMFPGDGLPGARELGLHRHVLANADVQSMLARGLAFLDRYATSAGVADFAALDEARRLAALDAAFASGEESIQPFVMALRYHLGTAYYASPAVKSAFAYTGPLQPDGFPDFRDRPA